MVIPFEPLNDDLPLLFLLGLILLLIACGLPVVRFGLLFYRRRRAAWLQFYATAREKGP